MTPTFYLVDNFGPVVDTFWSAPTERLQAAEELADLLRRLEALRPGRAS